jgi:hypothetical protein
MIVAKENERKSGKQMDDDRTRQQDRTGWTE